MPSRHLDPEDIQRQGEFDFRFPAGSLEGRVILAPGGCGGLGAATTALLARDGAHVIVGYRNDRERAERLAAKLNAGGSGRVETVQGDITQQGGRQRLLEAAERASGELSTRGWLASPGTRHGCDWRSWTKPP